LTSLHLDFSYHFADDLDTPNVHLCTTIRDNCQSLEYLTLSFPPSDNPDDTPRASVCHQLFQTPVHKGHGNKPVFGMLKLKKVEIIGHHSYCEGSSRKMVIDASEDLWATQNQLWWERKSGSLDHECLHTNIQIHGTPGKRPSLLNRRELCGVSSSFPLLSSSEHGSRQWTQRGDVYESTGCRPVLMLLPPSSTVECSTD